MLSTRLWKGIEEIYINTNPARPNFKVVVMVPTGASKLNFLNRPAVRKASLMSSNVPKIHR